MIYTRDLHEFLPSMKNLISNAIYRTYMYCTEPKIFNTLQLGVVCTYLIHFVGQVTSYTRVLLPKVGINIQSQNGAAYYGKSSAEGLR